MCGLAKRCCKSGGISKTKGPRNLPFQSRAIARVGARIRTLRDASALTGQQWITTSYHIEASPFRISDVDGYRLLDTPQCDHCTESRKLGSQTRTSDHISA